MTVKDCGDADCLNNVLIAKLADALKPFADFADHRTMIRPDHEITQGSRLAKRQLTMGDCYAARDALDDVKR